MRIKINDAQIQKRAQENLNRQMYNAEYEKKVARAARGITGFREVEKDNLTQLGITRTKVKEDHAHL